MYPNGLQTKCSMMLYLRARYSELTHYTRWHCTAFDSFPSVWVREREQPRQQRQQLVDDASYNWHDRTDANEEMPIIQSG